MRAQNAFGTTRLVRGIVVRLGSTATRTQVVPAGWFHAYSVDLAWLGCPIALVAHRPRRDAGGRNEERGIRSGSAGLHDRSEHDGQASQSPVLAESLTLFHAGRVYDYMENVGEVVIFEPLEHKFTILGPDFVKTTVTFDEIQQFLAKSRNEATRVLEEPLTDPASKRLAAALRAQFSPRFREQVRADSVKLTGESLIYDITTATAPKDTSWEKYLDYTDWAARLNFVLHPKSLYPDPRLEVNRVLKTNRRLPITVDLVGRLDDRELHLRAEHRYGWELQSIDRQFIDQWNTRCQAEDTRWVTIHEYQNLMAARKTASTR